MTTTVARKYILEIHDGSDDLVCILGNAHLIAYAEGINEAPTLSFNLPADDANAANIIKANEIYLRDYDAGILVNRFRLTRKTDIREAGLAIVINADGLINQLAEELVITYNADDLTITQIVTALLALQELTPVVTVGTINPTVSRSIGVDNDTLLKALYRLRDTVGGHIYVDENRALQWRTTIGQDVGQQIRYKKNLRGIRREIDYTTLANRIYAYGAGEGEARIKLSDADGQAEDYVENGDSQTEWGGIYIKVMVDKSITHPDTLLAWANLQLAELKDPRINYWVDAVDLSASDKVDFSFEALQIGSTIKIIDEDMGIDVSAQVVKIRHPDLLQPEQMQIEVANRTKDITDILGEVYDTQQLAEHIATTIGAGQVIVKGVFTVQDWVTAGETTIVGSNIETGTITADKLNVTALSAITANMGILTSGLIKVPATGWRIEINAAGTIPLRYWNGATDKFKVDNAGVVSVTGVITVVAGSNVEVGADVTSTHTCNSPDDASASAKANAGLDASGFVKKVVSGAKITGTPVAGLNITPTYMGYYTGAAWTSFIKSDGKFYFYGSANHYLEWDGANLVVKGKIYAIDGEFTGTLKVTTLEAGKTLTISGTISAGGGTVSIDTTGITIKSEKLFFKTVGAAAVGSMGYDGSGLAIITGAPYPIGFYGGGAFRLEIYQGLFKPVTAAQGWLGSSTYYWGQVVVDNVYAQNVYRRSGVGGQIGASGAEFATAYCGTIYATLGIYPKVNGVGVIGSGAAIWASGAFNILYAQDIRRISGVGGSIGASGTEFAVLYIGTIYATAALYPKTTNTGWVGAPGTYWYQVYCNILRYKDADTFQHHDDIALIRQLREDPARPGKVLRSSVPRELTDADEIEEGQEPSYDLGKSIGLAFGAARQLADRYDALEERLRALEARA